MRRFFSTSFIALALVVGAAGAAPAAHAAICSASTVGQSCAFNNGSAGVCRQNPEDGSYGCGLVITNTTLGTDAAQTPGAKQSVDPNLGKTDEEGFNKVMIWIMSLFAWLLGVAAITLDYAVFYTVVTMGDYINNLSAVGVTWSILRDIGNIIIIFGFLAIGISIILNTEKLGYGEKMLPTLLVAAVFLNFSLFLSEAVIDTGNLFATQFYTQIKGGALPTAKSLSETTILNAVEKEGISNKIMSQLGLQTIYGQARNQNKELFKGASPWFIGFMGIILFLVAAFVMFSLAFILIARFVILLFLIIISPIGFAGLAVPQLKSMANKWWGKLFEQTITAPVLLLLLYIALAVITDVQFLTGFGSGSAGPDWLGYVGVRNLTGFGSTILSFLVAMGLLLAVTIFSKNLAAFGGAGATKLAGKLTFGATAFGLRSTVGWGSQGLSRFARTNKYLKGTKTGRVLAGTFDRGAKASFDMRGVAMGGGLKGLDVDAGEASKGGYRARRDAAIKGHQDYIKSVGEAIDERGETKEQAARIAAAGKTLIDAEKSHKEAGEAHEDVKKKLAPQLKQQEAEVERLQAIRKTNIEKGISNQQLDNDLKAAQQTLATSKTNLDASEKRQKAATEGLEAAKKAEEKAKNILSEEKKEVQQKYAKNISGSFPGWVMFGPGGAVAARKIIKGKKNTVDLDEMKKYLEGKDKDEKPKGSEPKEEKKEEEKKPEAAKP